MRLDSILRESGRSIGSGTSRTATFACILAILALGVLFAEFSALRGITAAAAEYQAAGASVITLAAPGRIDGAACEAMSRVSGVRGAGAVRARDSGITAAALPSSSIPAFEVTQGFPSLLASESRPILGVFLSDQAAEALGLGPGDALVTHEGEVRLAGVYRYPEDGRRSGYGYAALVPTITHSRFDECWVDAWPGSPEISALMRLSLLPEPGTGAKPILSQLNTTLGTSFDGHARFESRVTRYAALVIFLSSAALGYIAVRSRRIQLASALHAGAGKAELAAVLGIEILSWTTPTAVFAAALTLSYAMLGTDEDFPSALTRGALTIVPALLGPHLGGAVALLLVRERHLFRYFKER